MNKVIVLEGLDFIFDRYELREIVEMWKKGFSVYYMSEYLEREPDEIFLALLHLSRNKRIEARKGGFFGG
ncbi:hypothetical protein [Bacillus benzoevorans]|uniref:Chromatin segregation and condensation protein Rec8/ScpA/Scc1 (Kleisin family) n=1 Tax=Bacillus benzoevorans TaxID=1456 RepID=A0A7X0HV48_9BACI|nr:hypothetical protein [Bacillus benzoevorans]MBB6446492.1 chromatin segregation and condensation protein Rec8/ScpA/Scc1 (kleisin family) [Bacillus benzoevorans]